MGPRSKGVAGKGCLPTSGLKSRCDNRDGCDGALLSQSGVGKVMNRVASSNV